MLFAIVQQALDFAQHQGPNAGKTLAQSEIGAETQEYIFLMACMFFLEFISAWFDQYSKYFAGLRINEVASPIDLPIQKLYDLQPVKIISSLGTEAFLVGQYMK